MRVCRCGEPLSHMRGLCPVMVEHREAETVGCRYCLAGAGQPCINEAQHGKPLMHPHPERLKDARTVKDA